MSIINEALKKTEQYLHEAKNSPQDNAWQPNSQNRNPPAKAAPKPLTLLIYILILLAGILLSKFIFDLLSRPQGRSLASDNRGRTPQTLNQKVEIAAAVVPPALPTAPATPLETNKAPELNFVLNGIFFSDNDGYALINNQIVRENDLVDGAKVIKITANTVELDNVGKPISLSTRR